MITMVTEKLSFPNSLNISTLLTPQSPLNPHFFAYGSFPIYLLKLASLPFAQESVFRSYDSLNLLGRLLSALFDTASILLIFKILFSLSKLKTLSLIGSLFYALSVFPIQLSHFYAVDTLLNFFILLTIWSALKYHYSPTLKNAAIGGFAFGLALATKVSALPVGIVLVFAYFLSHKKHLTGAVIMPVATLIIFILAQPYSLIDFSTFISQIREQSAMTSDAFVFPYTLQYVGTPAYIYPLKNIFMYGWGISLSLLSLLGVWGLVSNVKSKKVNINWKAIIIFLSFYIIYYLLVGRFSVKFMRYYLPLYPLLACLAALGVFQLKKLTLHIFPVTVGLLFLIHLTWLLAFMSIYQNPNPRTQASFWINQNIVPGSTILREHWDDGLPLFGSEKYTLIDLPLYEPDTSDKWHKINQNLAVAQYLIVASNRLYTPLQKLADCSKFPRRCYPQTAEYYQRLFSGQNGYDLVAVFDNEPQLFGVTLTDFEADESFTVYDHPRVFIFRKVNY
jgi:hypothetical protein